MYLFTQFVGLLIKLVLLHVYCVSLSSPSSSHLLAIYRLSRYSCLHPRIFTIDYISNYISRFSQSLLIVGLKFTQEILNLQILILWKKQATFSHCASYEQREISQSDEELRCKMISRNLFHVRISILLISLLYIFFHRKLRL